MLTNRLTYNKIYYRQVILLFPAFIVKLYMFINAVITCK